MNMALSTRIFAHHWRQEFRAYLSPKKPHISLQPVVCRFVECWLSVFVFGVLVFGRISAPIVRRLSAGGVGRARRGRDGGLFAVSTLAWLVEVEVEVFDCISASIGSRFSADRAPTERRPSASATRGRYVG